MSDIQPARPPALDGGKIEVVLFDIGGVLARFAGLEVMRELTGSDSELEVSARWLMSPWVRRFESGGCSDQEFADGLVEEWDLPYTGAEFLEIFPSWLDDPFPGAEQMLRETGERVRVGCLSNTNPLLWNSKISRWPLAASFELPFLSFELHAVKPDPLIFERVTDRLPVPPASVLFLDDVALNVEGARSAGLRAELAVGVGEAHDVLRRYGLLG